MANLYIIGNGFDLHHGIQSSYNDFRSVMQEYIHGIPPHAPQLPDKLVEGENENEVFCQSCAYFAWLVDDAAKDAGHPKTDWKDFEGDLGHLNYEIAFQLNKTLDVLDIYERLERVQDTLNRLFFDWISTVEITGKSFLSLKEDLDIKNDLVFTFNYIESMEHTYHVLTKNVCHIHGSRETNLKKIKKREGTTFLASCYGKKDERMIIGFNPDSEHLTERYRNCDPQFRHYIRALDERMKKKFSDIYPDHKKFYKKIERTHFKEIYSYGFSFSETDWPHMKELVNRLNRGGYTSEEMVWRLSSYDGEKERNEYKNIIRDEFGFRGKFGEPWELCDESQKQNDFDFLKTGP